MKIDSSFLSIGHEYYINPIIPHFRDLAYIWTCPTQPSYVLDLLVSLSGFVMIFGLKNACATYQCAINLIFHVLIGVIIKVYIDDIMIKKLISHESNLVDLCL